jgi:ribosome-associated toxin RatA of RatAB toxin-antitoxin module
MKKRLSIGIGLLAGMLLVPGLIAADDGDALDRGEILVRTVDVKGSSVPRVVVQAVVDAPPARVWPIVSDCDRYTERMPRIKQSRTVEKKEGTVICEVTVGLPFPMSDLRAKTTAKHVEGPPNWSRRWTLLEGDYQINDGSWELTAYKGDPNRTLAIYSVHAVPNTAIPGWARKRAQQSSMPEILVRVREAVK